jgi:hypothetical protein
MAKEEEITVTNVNLLHFHTYLSFTFTKRFTPICNKKKHKCAGAKLLATFDASGPTLIL